MQTNQNAPLKTHGGKTEANVMWKGMSYLGLKKYYYRCCKKTTTSTNAKLER